MLKKEQELIAKWYLRSHRQLPWRETTDAYKIWVSEIILQQTRVQQGLPYYERFIDEFPDVKALAKAREEDILHLWQGLGYYSRARNMHAAAKEIVEKHQGQFPNDYKSIRSLKGIGDYTAAAIASFAFGLPYAAVDGNVMRVISRLAGIEEDINENKTRKLIGDIAREMMGDSNPALFNQSMMEFGAVQCVKAKPQCAICPVRDYCVAYNHRKVEQIPLKINKTKVRNRYFDYLIIRDGENTFIKKRGKNDIWQGLFDFPLIEHQQPLNNEQLLSKIRETFSIQGKLELLARSKEIKHKLSHQLLHIHFNMIQIQNLKAEKEWKAVRFEDLSKFPFPEIINKNQSFIEKHRL